VLGLDGFATRRSSTVGLPLASLYRNIRLKMYFNVFVLEPHGRPLLAHSMVPLLGWVVVAAAALVVMIAINDSSTEAKYHIKLPKDLANGLSTNGTTWQLAPGFCASPPTSMACSPSGHTWLDPSEPFLHGQQACEVLTSCNLTRIAFVGDR
jgi:hypothetical protein